MKNFNNKQVILVSTEQSGQRIDNFLFNQFKTVPKSVIYRIIRIGKVRVNKKKVQPKYKITEKDLIFLPYIYQKIKKEKILLNIKKELLEINNSIIYEDDYLIAINKKSGIAVHGGTKINFGIIEKLKIIRKNFGFFELVHRLDKDTSGILLIAKSRFVLCELHRQFRMKYIKKTYLAIVHKRWPSKLTKVSIPIFKKSIYKKEIFQSNKIRKFSETFFRIKKYFSFFTLLKITLFTGKTHQIRIHTNYIGHPIVFDRRYGNIHLDKKIIVKNKKRLLLHAHSIKFKHPKNRKNIEIIAPIDVDFINFIKNAEEKYT